jgi:hypothetical protein
VVAYVLSGSSTPCRDGEALRFSDE